MNKFNNQPTQQQAGMFPSYFSDAIPVSFMPVKAGTYEADLYGEIENPSQFSNIISALSIMEENDTFVLNLQSGGGSLDALDCLVHAIRKCNGHVHIVASGIIASAATFLLLEAGSYELSEGFGALCHCGSLAHGGNFNEVKVHSAFYLKHMEKAMRSYYKFFFTEAELDALLDGKDFFLDAEGWVERYEQRNSHFQSKNAEACGDTSCHLHSSSENEYQCGDGDITEAEIAAYFAAMGVEGAPPTKVAVKRPKKAKNAPK